MTRISAGGITRLLSIVVCSAAANAQQPVLAERAPVPRQVLTARTVLIGNGASESYGATSYFHLTKYDGGPNRAYNSFYGEMKDWGHYDLVSATGDADLLLVIRFTNPVVERAKSDDPNDWIYDPQLNLSINDPRSGLALWSITEHIDPEGDRASANRHFDEAVTRLVDDLKRLILHPDLAVTPENIALPPGAIAAARREQREKHMAIGVLLGMATGGLAASHTGDDSCNDFNIPDCERRAKVKMRNEIVGTVGAAIIGGIVGWIWPVSF